MTFDVHFMIEAFQYIILYLPVTLAVVLLTAFFALLLGGLLAKLQLSKSKIGRGFAKTYIWIARCTPPIIMLFVVYYGLPLLIEAIFHININLWNKMIFVVIAFTLLFAATMAEIMRSSYQSIDKGQFEAGVSAGLTPLQTQLHIVFPQAFVVALPNLINALVNLMKDGALAYTIGLIDMMGASRLLIDRNYGSYALETYITLALIYWVLTIIMEKIGQFFERRFAKDKRKQREAIRV